MPTFQAKQCSSFGSFIPIKELGVRGLAPEKIEQITNLKIFSIQLNNYIYRVSFILFNFFP